MTPLETGKKLVALCKQNKNLEALDTLYSPDIVSVEPMSSAGMPAEMRGIDAIRGKNVWWFENQKVNSSTIEGPFVNGDRFTVNFKYDVTNKKDGKRMNMAEVGLYTVQKDKIVREEFFFSPEQGKQG